ncbi:MAG TPA: arginine deiminase family protein [Thermoanaerobaculia bacterium]|nr:arginine deiminase family protein [Thermoanaerobaculia bacterium]
MSLRVTSEIGKLKSVLVHLPGPEIDRMVPSMMEELLFDDILYGNRAREEHRRFQQVLGFVADEVLEIQDLLEEVLQIPEQRGAIIDDLSRTLGWVPDMEARLRDLSAEQLAAALVIGIEKESPGNASVAAELFELPPIPNYFFQRDPLVVVGERAIRGSMATSARLREPLLSGYVLSLHPRFANPEGGKFWFQEFSADYGKPSSYARMRPTLEGGDVLVLRDDLLAIGYSERTEKTTIERLAEAFKKLKSPIKRILVVAIPPERSFMHLDTVFTMISQDECLVYGPMILPDGAEEADVYECDLTKREITWTTEKDLLSALKVQKLDLKPIRCGGQDAIAERREQWTDGANAFALAPGVVLIYDRNEATVAELARSGYTVVDESDLLLGRDELELWKPGKKYVILLAAHELSRARGGPRCMTMPLVREDVKP